MIVLDASVVVKWFSSEPGSAEARALLRGDRELVAPELVQVEVASALVRKGTRRELAPATVRQALGLWFRTIADGQIVLLPDMDHLAAASELALELTHPVPDCLYLAMAQQLQADLVTADRQLARRAGIKSTTIRILGEDRV